MNADTFTPPVDELEAENIALCDEYDAYLRKCGLPLWSCDELLFEDHLLSEGVKQWLEEFQRRWHDLLARERKRNEEVRQTNLRG